jgi:hypothetical protein
MGHYCTFTVVAEEGAKADTINLAIIDSIWNLWKQRVQSELAKHDKAL